MRIGVDLDGVVANFTKGWTKNYEEEFGKKIQQDDIKNAAKIYALVAILKDLY